MTASVWAAAPSVFFADALLQLVTDSVFTPTGQSGLGKSTLMNTLFKSKVSRRSVLPAAQEKIPKTVEIKSISHGEEASSFVFVCNFICLLHGIIQVNPINSLIISPAII